MEVTLKNSVLVHPAQPTPRRAVWCSNMDQLVPPLHVPTVYFYRLPDSSPPGFFNAAVLKAALADVLVTFYVAAGRVRVDGKGRVEIDCNGEGAAFIEAECSVGLDEFGDFGAENGPKFMSLVPPVAAFSSAHDISACPLLLFQVTRFRCGGASLGVAFYHLIGDGFSAIHLINSWADTARGGVQVTPPFTDRTLLAAREPPAPSFPHPEYHAPPSMATQPPNGQPFVGASFRLTPAEIARLKSKAKGASGGGCTTYEAIVAHTWRCTCIARELPADKKTRLYMPVNLRGRLDPPLPSAYMGNAIASTVCDEAAGEVVAGSVEQLVGKVHAALAKFDSAYLRSALDYLQVQPDPTALRRTGRTFACPNLNVVSWVGLPIYGADFGWGRPVFMGPVVPTDGLAYVVPRPRADDGLSLSIGLGPAAMERFQSIFYDF